ncbi:peroxisome biogenesis protein 3-2-like [Coffea arabica]|uniref:Peroxisome biogenesis protein 3-2-like n=1 Tax=Coffea arabica TaxID=13443 RepID=A0A6P6X858_COFAR|nr:peroxisome biogenesis protein 3-2-like [Coffea arabica]XP_027123885.1 peroxisome biogenesis protein 3-2-like [Coffea arabica]
MWDFWRRHKRKVYITLGVLGSGYFLYKLYDAHSRRISDLERELATERENDELVKAQMQEHFENVQRIADSTTLPHVMQYLSTRVAEELDLAPLTERLMRGKGQPNTLTAAEKLELWDRLKILSFTRMVLSVWAMTTLNLFIRVQVNILGRHLYINTARGLGNSHLLDEADLIDRDDEQQFLAIADFLSNYEIPTLIASIEAATSEVLKGKQLKDYFNSSVLRETIVRILDTFMSKGNPRQWLGYLIPEDNRIYKLVEPSGSGNEVHSHASKFEQLTEETRAVLSSAEFGNILDISLKVAVDAIAEEIDMQSAIPLAKLLPRIAQMGQILLEEPNRQRYIQIIRNTPEVELFFTVLYSSMPS